MNEIDLTKDFIENQKYLISLTDILKNTPREKIDSNLAYEVAYASTYLSIIIENSSVIDEKWVHDCKKVFDMVLDSLDYNNIPKINKKDYKNLLSSKYKDVREGSFEQNWYIDRPQSPIFEYIKRKGSNIIILYTMLLITLAGIPKNLYDKVINNFSDYSSNDIILTNIFNIVTLFINIIWIVLFITYTLQILVDLLYISIPYFRVIIKDNKIISHSAIEVTKIELSHIKVNNIKVSYDRELRNIVWLHDLIELCKKANKKGKAFFIDIGTLKNIEKDIQNREKEKYYLALAKVEFLHNKLKELAQ